MEDKLYIPKRINVGFQARKDTYTGKLAYVIYWDDKGKLRKESSWNSWCWHKGKQYRGEWNKNTGEYEKLIYGDEFEPKPFDNVPTEGFVINKGVGGQRESYGWNARNEYIRIYDPRDFEFEISVANLLFILQETSAIKGKGLEGKFVYSWEGKELVLLPVGCQEYLNSSNFTDLQSMKLTKSDMVPGCTYKTKQQVDLMYLGKLKWRSISYDYDTDMMNVHVFYDEKTETFSYETGFTKLAVRLTFECGENFSDIMEKFLKSKYASKVESLVLVPKAFKANDYRTYSWVKDGDGYNRICIETESKYIDNIYTKIGYSIGNFHKLFVEDGNVKKMDVDNRMRHHRIYSLDEIQQLDIGDLFIKLESGELIEVDNYKR